MIASQPQNAESPSRTGCPAVDIDGELSYHLPGGDSAVLRFKESEGEMELEIILVPARYRSAGIGSRLIGRLLCLADAAGKPVITTARPIGQRSPEILARLVAYYERFGFQPVRPGVNAMHMRREASESRPARPPGS